MDKIDTMGKTVSDWNFKVIDTLKEARDKNISDPAIVGTFLGCAVATAKRSGATLENMIQLVTQTWEQ